MFTYGCYAQNKASQPVLSVEKVSSTKWNSPDGIAYKKVPGANLGAMAFEILNNNRIAFLCNSSSEIAIVNTADGKTVNKFPVTFAPRDFSYDKNKFYVLTEYKIDVYDESGKANNSFDFNRRYVGVERIARYNNSTYLLLPNGNSLLVESNNQSVEPKEIDGCITSLGNQVTIKQNGISNYIVTLISPTGNKLENTFQADKKVAGVFVVGTTSNRIVLDVQTYLSENPIKVERKIVSIEINKAGLGKIVSEIKVPNIYYVLSNKDISLLPNGTVYNMVTAPEGIFVYSLIESKSGNGYPKFLTDRAYHFNDHLIRTEGK